jgi:hypothetical protein
LPKGIADRTSTHIKGRRELFLTKALPWSKMAAQDQVPEPYDDHIGERGGYCRRQYFERGSCRASRLGFAFRRVLSATVAPSIQVGRSRAHAFRLL